MLLSVRRAKILRLEVLSVTGIAGSLEVGGIGEKARVNSAFMAESVAVLEGLKNGVLWGGEKVILETDCQALFDMLHKGDTKGCGWDSVDTVQQSLRLLQYEWCVDWELSSVAILGNKVADCLATKVMRGLVSQGSLSKPPTPLIQLMRADMEDSQKEQEHRAGTG